MSARPSDWAPLAGSDPVPGDPDVVRALARDLDATAPHLRDVAGRLRGTSSSEAWRSESGELFRGRAADTAGLLDRAADRQRAMAAALTPYAGELAEAQATSLTALRRAQDAAAESAALARQAAAVPPPAAQETPQATAAREAASAALQRRRASAGDALDGARRLLAQATARRDAAGERAAQAVGVAMDADGLQDGWFDGVQDWVGDRWDDATHLAAAGWQSFTSWVSEHVETIQAVQQIASTVAT